MEEMIYNVFHKNEWGMIIALYFYFTGLSAGTFVISSLYRVFGLEKYKPVAKTSAVLAVLLLAVAPILLLLDLGQPARFWHLFVPSYFHVTSVMAWGSLLLTLYPINALLYTIYLFKDDASKSKFFGMIGVPLAILVHGYTGFIFGVVAARAMWYSPLMPAFFLASAIVSGFGLVILITVAQDKLAGRAINKELVIGMGRFLSYFLALDLIFGMSIMAMLLYGPADAAAVGRIALADKVYLYGEILMGQFLPLLLLTWSKTKNSIPIITLSGALVVIFVFGMRYSLVFIGQALPLS
ncbi:MAG: NrfD/PsrC family molybdoenzyme membrane anchor subunit [Candidatus Hydrothermarchaeaceae archaeon]